MKTIVYHLKRRNRAAIRIYRPVTQIQDKGTGEVTRTFTQYKIRKAIILDTRDTRKFVYDLSFIAANKNFTYGGFFDISSRPVIIDVDDLPDGFEPDLDDHIVYNGHRYQAKEAKRFDEQRIVIYIMTEVKGIDAGIVFEETVEHTFTLAGDALD